MRVLAVSHYQAMVDQRQSIKGGRQMTCAACTTISAQVGARKSGVVEISDRVPLYITFSSEYGISSRTCQENGPHMDVPGLQCITLTILQYWVEAMEMKTI